MTIREKLLACLAAKSVRTEERTICTTYLSMIDAGTELGRYQIRFIEKLHAEVVRQVRP